MTKLIEARNKWQQVIDETITDKNTGIRVGGAGQLTLDAILESLNPSVIVQISTQTDLDAFRPQSGFAIVTMGADIDTDIKAIFGTDNNKIEIHSYTVGGTGTDAVNHYQEGVSAIDGKRYRRFYSVFDGWGDFELNDFEQTLNYFGNWSSAIPTYYPNLMYKYRGELYIPKQEHNGSIDPFTDTANWKPMTSVIGRRVILQSDLDEFSINPQHLLIDRSNTNGTTDIQLPINVSDEFLIVKHFFSRSIGAGGNIYIQEFTDGNAMQYKRTAIWYSGQGAGYYWGSWICENEIPLIGSLGNLIGFHKSIKNNQFVNSANAVCQVTTGTEPGLIAYFGENRKLIITAKTVGSYPGSSVGDMIYEYTNAQGIRLSALYTSVPTEALTFFEECPVLITDYELDNYFYSNAFAKVALGGISSMHLAFGSYGYVSMRSFTIETTGAGAYMQVATNEYGVDYKRSYSILDGWTEWTLKDVQTDVSVGGYANNLYFSEVDSDVPTYKILSYTPDVSGVTKTAVVNTSEGNKVIQNYLYPSAVNVSQIPSGVWSFTFYGKISNNSGISKLGVQYFARTTSGTENVLFAAWSNEINNTTNEIFKFETTNPVFNVNPTDRMGARILAYTTHNSNVTISYTIGDGFGAWLNNPNKIRHNQLRALNEDMAYQHINTQQSKIVPLQTDSLAIYDSVTNTVKLVEKKNLDEVYVGTSAPTHNEQIWIDNTADLLVFKSNTTATITPNNTLAVDKYNSNYAGGNTVAVNSPTFDTGKHVDYDDERVVVIKNTKAGTVTFVLNTFQAIIGGVTYNYIALNGEEFDLSLNKYAEISYLYTMTSATTCDVLIRIAT